MPAAPDIAIEQPPLTVNPDTIPDGEMFNDGLRAQLDAAMKAKAADATKPPTAAVDELPPPAKPAAKAIATTPKPDAAPAKPDAAPSRLPTPDAYVPGQTRAADWARIKAERDEATRERDELRARVGTSPPVDTKTLDALKAERDDYAARLQAVAIEQDPKFQREYQQAAAPLLEMAKSVVGPEHAATVEMILAMPPGAAREKAVDAVMTALPERKQSRLETLLFENEKLIRQRDTVIADRRANWSKLQAEAEAETRKREAAHRDVLETTLRQWSDPDPKKGLPFLQRRDGDAEWNKGVDATINLAREIYGGNLTSVEDTAKAAIWAAVSPHILSSHQAAHQRIAELEAENAALKGVQPGAGDGGSGGTAPGAETGDIADGTEYGSAVAQAVRKAGLM